jgi:hypothetical protein
MEEVYWTFRYLKSSPDEGLLFSRHDHFKIEAYTNIDWQDQLWINGPCQDFVHL